MTYRRSKNSNREFFKIDGLIIIRVVNKEFASTVTVCSNILIKAESCDPYSTVESNEVEFNVAFEAALKRIQTMTL